MDGFVSVRLESSRDVTQIMNGLVKIPVGGTMKNRDTFHRA